ncbi:Gfo/Idh/MocA family oxidoreductase [Pricia sp. S334]|uniref:Gfo/Idh/MocA family oxidoreductase n=1 Tax=Pricia mediterranea TaxID=3076079 RepID=A0ABU3L9W1_9FLAO|nr:Gfo/Idh/MocA family oxidoreductase [Pricia sp. S334]MDT7830526.1 Gfo/Idh/MocA family oxidoreductase [Pricia sp. S334]
MEQRSKKSATAPSRRSFVKNSLLGFGAITILPRHVLGRGITAPSDRINLGYIGLGKQGGILANKFIDKTEAQIVAGSDVWKSKRKLFEEVVSGSYAEKRGQNDYKGVKTYLEYQKLLSRKDIDAVIIATPDHWHAIQAIDALNAGKDVYCEKPLTNTVYEGRQIVNAVKKNKAVFQTGSMQRSWDRFKKAKETINSGKLGKIEKVIVNVGDPAIDYNLPKEPMPKGLDWNLWCGPAPLLDYNSAIAPEVVKSYPDWRDFKETGGGILADWGAHMFDIAQWCLGMDDTGPVRFTPPVDPKAVRGLKMVYENGVEVVHEDFGRGWAVRFIGSEGILDVGRSFLESLPLNIVYQEPFENPSKMFDHQNNHYDNWLSAIKSRGETICPAETGHRSATVCNVANIAYWLGKPLEWNPVKEQFKGNEEANALLKRQNRNYS